MPEEEIDVLNWIDNYTNNRHNLVNAELDFIRDYTLLWHLFEKEHFDRFFKERNVAGMVDGTELDELEAYLPFLDYFQRRYISNGSTNDRFLMLGLSDANRRRLVERVLIGEITDTKEVVKTLIYIVGRYRNNLFHGEKDLVQIPDQHTNFEIANEFLMQLMEDLRR